MNIKRLHYYQKISCVIVYYVLRSIMRVITLRATMPAGDQSQGVAEAKPRRSRASISPASILSESRNYPNCVHWHIFYTLCDFGAFTSFSAYTRIQSEKVEIAVIIDHFTFDISRILPAILISSILCSSSIL